MHLLLQTESVRGTEVGGEGRNRVLHHNCSELLHTVSSIQDCGRCPVRMHPGILGHWEEDLMLNWHKQS